LHFEVKIGHSFRERNHSEEKEIFPEISADGLMSLSNRLDHLRVYFPAVALAVEKIRPGEVTTVGNIT